jgi:hypothetical protein
MGDNIFNDSEKTSVTISGTTAGVEENQTVWLTFDDGEHTLEDINATVVDANWTVDVNLSIFNDGNITIVANVEDKAGNAAEAVEALVSTFNRTKNAYDPAQPSL